MRPWSIARCALLLALLGAGHLAAAQPPRGREKAPAAPAAAGRNRAWAFVGTILDVGLGVEAEEKVVPVGMDPHFRLRMRIESWQGEEGPFKAGSRVFFFVHSPSLVFCQVEPGWYEKKPWVGKRYLFKLYGRPKAAGRFDFTLLLAERPAAAKAPP